MPGWTCSLNMIYVNPVPPPCFRATFYIFTIWISTSRAALSHQTEPTAPGRHGHRGPPPGRRARDHRYSDEGRHQDLGPHWRQAGDCHQYRWVCRICEVKHCRCNTRTVINVSPLIGVEAAVSWKTIRVVVGLIQLCGPWNARHASKSMSEMCQRPVFSGRDDHDDIRAFGFSWQSVVWKKSRIEKQDLLHRNLFKKSGKVGTFWSFYFSLVLSSLQRVILSVLCVHYLVFQSFSSLLSTAKLAQLLFSVKALLIMIIKKFTHIIQILEYGWHDIFMKFIWTCNNKW